MRLVSSTVCSALLLAMAACGSGERPAPELPPEVGTALASHAADVTAALEAGDPAGAEAEAEELLAAVESAIAAGDVPRPLAAEVRRGAERLLALVDAAQPPPAPEPPPEDDGDDEEDDDEDDGGPGKSNGKGQDKKDKQNENGDDD